MSFLMLNAFSLYITALMYLRQNADGRLMHKSYCNNKKTFSKQPKISFLRCDFAGKIIQTTFYGNIVKTEKRTIH